MIKNFAKHFLKWITTERSMTKEEAKAVWFSQYEGCYPEGFIEDGDIVMKIIDKFYYPLDFLASLLEKSHPELKSQVRINVMPSYEDHTYMVVTYKGRVLYDDNCKAWNFAFPDRKEFNEWAKQVYEEMEKKLQLYVVVETSQLIVNNVHAFSDWGMAKQKFKEITNVPYEKYLRQVRTKNDCDVLGDADQTKVFVVQINE